MIKIGEYNQMRVVRLEKEGAYLTNDYDKEALLFHYELKSLPEVGDEFTVFIYSDSDHPFIATLQQPKIILNDFALMKVIEANATGAFLDWGIGKDLFVPFAEQKTKMQEGKHYIVKLLKDEFTNRLFASSKLNRYLSNENCSLKIGEKVDLVVFEKTDLGVKVIINTKHTGLIFRSDIIQELKLGDKLPGFIKYIREDGKIDVTLRRQGHHEIIEGETVILDFLNSNAGFMDMNDDSDPQEIRDRLNMSKKTFKKALGALYKKKLIKLEPDGVYLIQSN